MTRKMNRICCNATSCRGWLRTAFQTDLSVGALNLAMKQVLLRNVLYISRKLKLSLVGSWVASVGHSATNSGECRLGGDLRGMGGRWRVWAERNFRRCLRLYG